MEFAIGYNQEFEDTIRILDEYRDYVNEIYFPVPSSFLGSGRSTLQSKRYAKEVEGLIKECGDMTIKRTLLINPTCEGNWTADRAHMYEVVDYVKGLASSGLESIILVNPLYMALIREEIPELEIQASVNCFCQTVEHAMYLKDLGCDILTVDRDVNRNIKQISRLKERTGMEIKILLNEGCLSNCPFRKIHFNQIAHLKGDSPDDTVKVINFATMACIAALEKSPEKCFRSPFIRPEDLSHYANIGDYFKLATRTMSSSLVEETIKAYADESFDGNLVRLLETQGLPRVIRRIDNKRLDEFGFFRKITTCNEVCDKCNYCKTLLEEAAELWDNRIPISERNPPP